MNAEQKQRALTLLGMWYSSKDSSLREYQAAELMAALLQELVDGYDATAESSSLIYHGDGTCTLKPGVKAIAYGGDTSAHLIGLPPVGELQIDATQPAPKLSDERILEIYEEAKANWNAQADQCNQWSDLGVDEVVTLVARAIEREILGE